MRKDFPRSKISVLVYEHYTLRSGGFLILGGLPET